MGFADRWQLVN